MKFLQNFQNTPFRLKIGTGTNFWVEIPNIIHSKSQNLVKTLKTLLKPLKSKGSDFTKNWSSNQIWSEDYKNRGPETIGTRAWMYQDSFMRGKIYRHRVQEPLKQEGATRVPSTIQI